VTLLTFVQTHQAEVLDAIGSHIRLCACALTVAIALGVPVGIWCSRAQRRAGVVAAMTALRVVPSLALLTLLLPVLGLGFAPALVALVVLGCPPILVNTYVGYRDVDPAVREAAAGMGMKPAEVLRRVESPLAMPVVLTGVKTAAVEIIASATLATFIGGGGLGDLINNGLQLDDTAMLATGAILVAALALIVEWGLSGVGAAMRRAQGIVLT